MFDCTIEEFYECYGGNDTSPDICEPQPEAVIRNIDDDNKVTLVFDADMKQIDLSSSEITI